MMQDAVLRRALLEAAAADFAGEAPEAPRSPRQEKRMNAMLADPFAYARRVRRPWWRQALHSAAMVTVTVGLSIALLAAVSPTVRAAITQWFMEIRNSDIVYYFTGETKNEELPYYTITDLPEGYEQTNVVEGPFSRHITYENADGQKLRFSYTQMAQGSAQSVKTEGAQVKDITVEGCPGVMILPADTNIASTIMWTDETGNVQFVIDAHVSESVLLHMADSVSLAKTEKP